jgi:hypothetical protein
LLKWAFIFREYALRVKLLALGLPNDLDAAFYEKFSVLA